MTFYEKYLRYCRDKGVSPSAAALAAGLTKTSVYRWKNGSMPTDSNVLLLADYFGCKPVDLLSDADEDVSVKPDTPPATITLEGLKEDERFLLESYRTMDDAARFAMQTFAKGLRHDN